MRSHRTKSGNGRTYSAPWAEVTQSREGVSGDGPTRTQIIALFTVLLLSVKFIDSEAEGIVFDVALAGVLKGGLGAEKGFRKFVVIWGWIALSKWGQKLYSA